MNPSSVIVPEPGFDAHMKFECVGYGRTVTLELEGADTALPEVLESFAQFLRGCGYYCGELQEVEDEPEQELER